MNEFLPPWIPAIMFVHHLVKYQIFKTIQNKEELCGLINLMNSANYVVQIPEAFPLATAVMFMLRVSVCEQVTQKHHAFTDLSNNADE